eukprot:tig00000219_g19436.t1
MMEGEDVGTDSKFTWPEEIKKFDYFHSNGMRYVAPYPFNFMVSTKRRWIGRKLVEVFTTEFPYYSREYYEGAIRNGRVTVNGKKTHIEYTLKDSDLLGHMVHRHEPPVSGEA